MVAEIIKLCGFAMLSVILCVTVRQMKPEGAVWVSVAAGIMLLGYAVRLLAPSVESISELAAKAGIGGDFAEILLKALAISYITALCADCARDAGQSALGAKVELAGRISIAALSLPVFISLAEIITAMIDG